MRMTKRTTNIEYRSRYAITCAEFQHAQARALCAAGDIDGAKQRVAGAADLFPPIRPEMADDPGLAGLGDR